MDRVHAGLRMPPTRQVRLCRPADAVEAMRPIHDAARRSRPGMLDRAGLWWEVRIDDPEAERDGTGPLRAAVVDDAAYALYGIKEQWQDRRAASEVRVRELVASTPEGAAAIWGFLLGLDLTSRLVYEHGAARRAARPHARRRPGGADARSATACGCAWSTSRAR